MHKEFSSFQKAVIMPKGEQLKSKGSIINIPVECDTTCSMLPHASGILVLKFKKNLNYCGDVYFQSVRPAMIRQALSFLKAHNHLYGKYTTKVT